MNQITYQRCKNCNKIFAKLTSKATRSTLPIGVRGYRYVTCSKKCSKENYYGRGVIKDVH